MEAGFVEFNWTVIFQIVNTLLWGVIIYLVYYFFKNRKRRFEKIEKDIEELKTKLNI
jgi:uncharacterized membrane-anchored protein YhcB (DUF1043 family)